MVFQHKSYFRFLWCVSVTLMCFIIKLDLTWVWTSGAGGELQWILNEDFSLYSFHTVLTVTLNAFIQSARADLKAVPVILTFLLSFRWLLLLLFQFPQQWGVFDIQQRPCVLAGPSVFSAIVPVFLEHGRAVVIFFKFSCILISPSSVFFF